MSDKHEFECLTGEEITPEIEREIRDYLAYLDAHPELKEEDGDAWLERTLNPPMPDLNDPSPEPTEEELERALELIAKLEQEEPFTEA
jgi:hypothetical protein